MATIVLRVRLLGGEHTDLTYDDPDQVDENEMVEQVIEVLSEESGGPPLSPRRPVGRPLLARRGKH